MVKIDLRHKKLFIIAGLIVLIDQATKMFVVRAMPLFYSVEIIPGFFNLTHIKNPGGAFGFLSDSEPHIRLFILIFVSIAAIFFLFYLHLKTPPEYPLLSGGFALVFGGAMGNIIDRVRFGEVTDFLDFYFRGFHWPAFNAADSAITTGMSIVIFYLIVKKKIFD